MICHGQQNDLSQIYRTPKVPANPNANQHNPRIPPTSTSDAKFQINSAKRYVLVVTLSINHNIKFLENAKQRFERTISWNKYNPTQKQQLRLYD